MTLHKKGSNRGCILFLLILVLIYNLILSFWEPPYYLQASFVLIGTAIILIFLSGVKNFRIYSNILNVTYGIYLVVLFISKTYDQGLRYTRSPLWDETYFVVKPEKVLSYDYKPFYYSNACYFDSSAVIYANHNRCRCIGLVILGQSLQKRKIYVLKPLYSAPSTLNDALSIFVNNRIVFCTLQGLGEDFGIDDKTTFGEYEKKFSIKNNSFFRQYFWKFVACLFGVSFFFMIFYKYKISKN